MDRRIACITGASRGIGKALVKEFIQNDYDVIAISRSRMVMDVEFHSDRLTFISADITHKDGLAKVEETVRQMESLDVLIHNAGTLIYKPFGDINGDELRKVYEVNVFAPFELTQMLMPYMRTCHVVNISSVGGVENSLKFSGLSAYSSSKAALNCLTQMLAEEFKHTNNTFNCLALGSVQTEMFSAAFPGATASCSPKEMAQYIFDFANSAHIVQNGKIIIVSKSNP